MNQSLEWVQKDLPFTQPLGNCGTDTEFFPLIVFTSHELSMSSARSELFPSHQSLLLGIDEKSSKSSDFSLRWISAIGLLLCTTKLKRNPHYSVLPIYCLNDGSHARYSINPQPFSHSPSRLALSSSNPLQINTKCMCPVDQSLVPAFSSVVFMVGGIFLEICETGWL